MKINKLKRPRIAEKKSTKKVNLNTSTDFFNLLEQQLPSIEPTATLSPPESVSPPSAVSPKLRLDGVSLSENTIDLLEALSSSLSDLTLPSEDLTPLIEALEGDTTTLLDIKEQLPADDPLAELINRIATITLIETEKYRRGDYNS